MKIYTDPEELFKQAIINSLANINTVILTTHYRRALHDAHLLRNFIRAKYKYPFHFQSYEIILEISPRIYGGKITFVPVTPAQTFYERLAGRSALYLTNIHTTEIPEYKSVIGRLGGTIEALEARAREAASPLLSSRADSDPSRGQTAQDRSLTPRHEVASR